MGLTQVSTDGVKNDAITKVKIPANQIEASELADNAVDTAAIADQAVALSKLPHGTSSNDGKFLRANNGADPSFETVTSTTINNNADNRVITGSGTANTLEGESNVVVNGGSVGIGTSSPETNLHVQGAGDGMVRITSADGSSAFLDLGDVSDKDGGRIQYNTDSSLRFSTASSERMRIDSSGRLIVGATSSVVPFQVLANASGYGGMNTTGVFSDATSYAANVGGGTTFSGKYNSGGSQVGFASLRGIKENATDGNYAGALTLNSRPNGGNMTERCRVDSAGVLRIGNTTYQGTSSNTKRIALGAKASIWGWASGQINGALTLADNYYWTGANNVAIESDHAAYLSLRSGSMRFGTTSSSQTGGNNISGGIHEKIRFQQGGGISFNGDTAAANALDDYEEGTWTPNPHGYWSGGWRPLVFSSGSINGATYTKVGRLVYFKCYFDGMTISGNGKGTYARVYSLPFQAANNGYGSVAYLSHSNAFENTNAGSFYISPNASDMVSTKYGSDDYNYATWSNSNGFYMMVSGVYEAA